MVAEVEAPERLWRVHRGADPLHVRPPRPSTRMHAGAGDRFDSPDGEYGVLYVGSNLTSCFGEVLARLRPDPNLAAMVKDDCSGLVRSRLAASNPPLRPRVTPAGSRVPSDGSGLFLSVASATMLAARPLRSPGALP